ncbi:hypothetical protein ACQRBN_16905 [Bariatricus sp. SGI.154]|uniref:hypothetical protein n=1 Tax=Bariatricus sp. SGI.154 TaxID=3420549 RepID=UPI003D034E1F
MAIFTSPVIIIKKDYFNLGVLGLAVETNLRADLCVHTLENILTAYPSLEGYIIHSDYAEDSLESHVHQFRYAKVSHWPEH